MSDTKSIDNDFSMLLKFGSRCNLEKLQKGNIYMKNLQYYIDLENSSDDEDVGDKFDGLARLQDVKISMFTVDSDEFVTAFQTPELTMDLGYKKAPVFCMFMFDHRNHTSERLNGDELTVRYDFSDEQRTKLQRFGDSVLLIKNGDEFVARMKQGFLDAGISFTRDFVNYYDGNILQHFQDIHKDNSRIAFWKRNKYSYQQEYRFFAFDLEVEDNICVNIGDISDISQLESAETILNTYLESTYKVSIKP